MYKGKTTIYDDEGYESGESGVTYEDPVKIMANVSPATGESQIALFGSLDNYDKVIVIDNIDCPIDENTVLFVDKSPDNGSSTEYDYTVFRVAKSLNSVSIAVSKVKVSAP